MTDQNQAAIEQRTEEWYAARLGKVTASRISDVMMKPTTKGHQGYQAELIAERLTGKSKEFFTSYAMQEGIDTEPQARAEYEMRTGNLVEEVGFVNHPTLPYAGASPDGLIGLEGGLEIKVPAPHTHIGMLASGVIPKDYGLQIQWQMACADRKWVDFVSFCRHLPEHMQMLIQRVERDDELIEEIEKAVGVFNGGIDDLMKKLEKNFKEAA